MIHVPNEEVVDRVTDSVAVLCGLAVREGQFARSHHPDHTAHIKPESAVDC